MPANSQRRTTTSTSCITPPSTSSPTTAPHTEATARYPAKCWRSGRLLGSAQSLSQRAIETRLRSPHTRAGANHATGGTLLAEAPASPLMAPVRQRPALAWVSNTNSSCVCPTHWYVLGMVRTLDLTDWAGRWVALDEHDRVVRGAETLEDLMSIIDTDGLRRRTGSEPSTRSSSGGRGGNAARVRDLPSGHRHWWANQGRR